MLAVRDSNKNYPNLLPTGMAAWTLKSHYFVAKMLRVGYEATNARYFWR